ncbi:MAG: hypothetical protein QW128_00285 [Thermoprotei archaeon]
MSSIEDTFLQAKLEFDLYPIKVKITKPTCKLEFGGISINPANPGEVIEVPRIIADALLKDGYCELTQPEITLDALNKIVFAEEKTKELKKLDPYFYQKTKWILSLMEKGYIKSSEHDIRRYKQLLTDLEERRLRKILTLIPLKEAPQITDRLTVEEQNFYNKLVKMINQWRINLMSGGELDD